MIMPGWKPKTARAYYLEARAMGAFRAEDCWRMAKEAAALDENAYAKRRCPPTQVWWESMPDGSAPVKLSAGVYCF